MLSEYKQLDRIAERYQWDWHKYPEGMHPLEEGYWIEMINGEHEIFIYENSMQGHKPFDYHRITRKEKKFLHDWLMRNE